MNRRHALLGTFWASCAGVLGISASAQQKSADGDGELKPVSRPRMVETQEKRAPRTSKTETEAEEPPPEGFEEAGAINRQPPE